ncbi:MAG: glycosyltransferase family 4 protein [Acidovorax sp.]|uniref:glycosyltransferase family 4 protein n=1 Tax=Acidovorax sp. TaxID=1872122 RepID=UPI0039189417
MTQDSKLSSYLFVIPWGLHHVGGVNQVVISLAAEMVRAASFKPIFLIDDWDAPNPVWEKFGTMDVVRWRIRTLTPGMGLQQRCMYALWKRQFGSAFKKFCADHKVAAINLHYPGANAFSLVDVLKHNATKVPVLLSFHGTDLQSIEDANATERNRWTSLTRDVRGVVACSHDLSRRIKAAMGPLQNLAVIHNGVNAESFVSRRQPSVAPSEMVLLSVGKFEKKKGQDVLIEAFASIAHDYPDLRLVLVGKKDIEQPNLQRLCEERSVEARVSFFTDVPHSNIADHFNKASVFVLPSRQEAFGIVLLEAGCFALPVIASKVGGIPEIIEDGTTGLLVAPDSPHALALALRSLLDEPTKGEAMGRALQLRVNREFTWTHSHDQYVRLVRA